MAILLLALFIFKPSVLYRYTEKSLLTITRPFAYAASAATAGIHNFFANWSDLRNLRAKYKQISLENIELKKQVIEKTVLKNEDIHLSLLKARVISGVPSNWDKFYILNKGARDGVRPRMGVMTTTGVCGVITSVAPAVSKMARIDDRSSKIGAMLKKNKVKGLVSGYDDNYLNFEYIPFISKVEIGDTVVTTGGASIFPKGLLIGYVVKAEKYEYKTYQDIYLKTAANLNKLDFVYIIKSKDLKQARQLLNDENN